MVFWSTDLSLGTIILSVFGYRTSRGFIGVGGGPFVWPGYYGVGGLAQSSSFGPILGLDGTNIKPPD